MLGQKMIIKLIKNTGVPADMESDTNKLMLPTPQL